MICSRAHISSSSLGYGHTGACATKVNKNSSSLCVVCLHVTTGESFDSAEFHILVTIELHSALTRPVFTTMYNQCCFWTYTAQMNETRLFSMLPPCDSRQLYPWRPNFFWKSKSRYGWRSVSQSVSQCVLISSPFGFSWPNVCCCLMVTVVSLWGALSDERLGLSFANQESPVFSRLSVCT
jgi:hypothetical protein